MFISTAMHVVFFFYSVILKNSLGDTSLERREGTEYSKLWTPMATSMSKMEQFLFIGDFLNVGQGIFK